MDQLKKLENEIKKCVKCGACRAHCPAFGALGREPAVARGKVALARAILNGGLSLDDRTYLDMSNCLLCGSCVEKCANDVPVDEIVIAARAALAKQRGLTTFHRAVGRLLRNRGFMNAGAAIGALMGPLLFRRVPATSGLRLRFPLPYIGSQRHLPRIAAKPFLGRHPEIIPGAPGKPRVLYFVGCMTNFIYTGIGEAAVDLLGHLGCTVIIPGEQLCCGLPAMSGGDLETACFLAEKNLAALEKYEADYIMTACASCGAALHKYYPDIIGKRVPALLPRLEKVSGKAVDASVLLQKLGFKTDATATGKEMTITYHDPCHLRARGVTRQPRELLQSVPGVHLAEMEGADICCGLGGTFNVYHYDTSMKINAGKSAAIENTGATAVATGCPGCMMQLADGLGQRGAKVAVMHTIELLARHIRCRL
ncbi:MAG TPA: (Fe-S)-binding protein [Geobacteraceae bacterium]|nr:(Fe-S)-binding protein [Geobacteraceae bacterium]